MKYIVGESTLSSVDYCTGCNPFCGIQTRIDCLNVYALCLFNHLLCCWKFSTQGSFLAFQVERFDLTHGL